MSKNTKEFKLKRAMLAYLDNLCTEAKGQATENYTECEKREARFMALGSGLVYPDPRAVAHEGETGPCHITWKGLQFRQRAHRPIRFWLKKNWFPAIVALSTIVSSIASLAIAL